MSKRHQQLPEGRRECKLYVEGMHCASCEILIEKKLLKRDDVEFADASTSEGEVSLILTGGNPNLNELNEEFKELGYSFSDRKIHHKNEPPLIGFSDKGELQVNPKKLNSVVVNLGIAVVILLGFLLLEKSGVASSVSVTSDSPLYMFALFGLVAGTSSCAALVGGLLLSLAKQWNETYIAEESKLLRAQPHLMFHAGRVVSFFLLGGVLGMIGEAVSFSLETTAIITILVGFMMLILGLQMLEVHWATKIQFRLPKAITRVAADEQSFSGKFTPLAVGAMTFFLPCGFTIVAQTIALASGSFLSGALIMSAFVLGTLPVLAAISISSIKFNEKPHFTARFNKIAGILVLFFAIYNLNAQLNLLGLPSLSDINIAPGQTEQVVESLEINQQGEQILQITADNFEYIPTSSTTLKAGVPAVIEVNNKGVQGCGAFMAARGLFDGYVALQPGMNRIEFTPEKGTYKLTCTMGMVPPVTIQVV